MRILEAVLDNQSSSLEQQIVANPSHINYPIGLPFDQGGRFVHRGVTKSCDILQHPGQRILDIASALPHSPVMWVLIAHGAKGSTHPLGSDLALHNAIKNGRTANVQVLLNSGHSQVNGSPETSWRPLLCAVLWRKVDIVEILLERGALVDDEYAAASDIRLSSPLELALEQRRLHYTNVAMRNQNENVLRMLLEKGANVHPVFQAGLLIPFQTPFQSFLRPWEASIAWAVSGLPDDAALACLKLFLASGVDLDTPFAAFPCSEPKGKTFAHQVLYHSTPEVSRLLVDTADPTSTGNGALLLHHLVGRCSHAKRHPTDTVRDILVLLSHGADSNHLDEKGDPPLMDCIRYCPSVDMVSVMQALLEGGADPQWIGADGKQAIVSAARYIDTSLLFKVMELMLSKCMGPLWMDGNLPIPEAPTYAQLMVYVRNGQFEKALWGCPPDDAVPIIQKAAFSVASKRYLDAGAFEGRGVSSVPLSQQSLEELQSVLSMRREEGLPDHAFSQSFVLRLLHSPATPGSGTLVPASQSTAPPALITTVPSTYRAFTFSTSTSLSSMTAASSSTSLISSSHLASQSAPTQRRSSTSSDSSAASVPSFFFSSTTQIRFPALGRVPQPEEMEKAKTAVLKYKCRACDNGVKLTLEEHTKHKEEHAHTAVCDNGMCMRRFCVVARRNAA